MPGYLPIDEGLANEWISMAVDVRAHEKRPGGDRDAPLVHQVNKAKVPLWAIEVKYTPGGEGRSVLMDVRVPAHSVPEIDPGRPIRFGGLSVFQWEMGDRQGLTWTAETFTQEEPPSAKRPKAETPPVPPSPGSKAA